MARESASAAAGDLARYFEVTADASGDFVVRAVAAHECAHSSDTPRAGHEVPPRTPPDLAFLPAHVSIGRAEDCDAHLRAFLGTLRRLGPAGCRVGAARDEEKASPSSASAPADAHAAAERVERVAETERVPETEFGVRTDSQTRRVPETEFPEEVKCSLQTHTPSERMDLLSDEEEPRVAGTSRETRTNVNSFADALPDVPSIPLDDPHDDPHDETHTERVPETLLCSSERLRGKTRKSLGGEETKALRGDDAFDSTRHMRDFEPDATPAASTRSRRRSRIIPTTAAKTPFPLSTTPYTELRLTEDGLFSPAPETVARAGGTVTTPGTRGRGAVPGGAALPRFGALGEQILPSPLVDEPKARNDVDHDAYFADLHRRQQRSAHVSGPLMNPRGGAAGETRRLNAFTYPSPAAATPASLGPRAKHAHAGNGHGNEDPSRMAYPGRSPLAPPPFPGLETPGAPWSADISNLTARDLVAMPTRGGVTIRTAAEAEAEAEPDPEAEVVGGGSPDDDPCFAAGDDAGNAAAPPETVMVPDTFAVDDDAREPLASGFAFRGGSQKPLPSPAAMAVDERAAPLDLHSRGRTANADPKTPAGGFGGFAAGGGFDDTAEKPAASRFLDDSAAKAKAPPSAFGGFASFSTASGKTVEVSAEAMAKAAAMLDGGEKPKAAAAMFSTGSGKAVEVSAEAMAKAAAVLDGGEKPKAAAAPNRAAAPARFVSPAASPAPAPRPAAAAPAPAPKSRAAAHKSAGFQSPMLAGAPRPALAKRRLDVAAATAAEPPNRAAPASRFQKQKTASKTSGAPSVHDLFASRGALREGYASFFRGLAPRERLPTRGSPPSRLDFVSSDLAAGFRVVDAEGRAVGARELRRRMLAAGCVSRLLDPDWVQNAYRWVVWHHVCVVRSFPETLTDGLLTASAVEQRLLYRYERETLRAARPFLRRVWERDAPASAPAVLVVAAIRRLPNATIDKERGVCENNENLFLNGAELELSDGWYGAPARCDAATTSLVNAGAIRVGSKLLVQGLELLPKDGEPANPLADEALDSFLALRRNQVRPAPWDAKLGARRETAAFPLRSVAADGGAVKKILLHVERVYPSTWVESDRPDGKNVHRSELAEKRAARAWEEARAAALERLQDALSFANENDLDEGASEARARAALEAQGLFERRTRRAAKLRVSGVRSTDANATASHHTGSALLTVYDLDEDAAARLEASEGATFEVTDVSARLEKKEGGLELVASRRSRWRRVAPSALARAHLAPKPTPRRLATVRDLSSETSFGPNAPRNDGKVRFGEEFDCVAAIVRVARPTPQSAPTSQWVFLADASVGEALDSGFAPDLSSMSCDAELLAVETHVTHAEAFVDAEAWGAGAGFEKAQNSATTKNSFETIPVALENLMYTRRDAANGVRVAAFTERSRATPLRVLGGTPNAKRRGPFGAGPNAPLAARAARALRRRFGSGRDENENENENGGDARTTAELRNALLARVRALTGSADESPSEMDIARPGDESARPGVPARRASLRRKRSLSLGSDAEWGASQLDVIEAVEAKALEARRRRGAETQ